MHYNQLTFVETIKELCILHNIRIKNKNNNDKNHFHQKNLYQLMENISTYYKNNLIQKKYLYAEKYLQHRGLNTEILNTFNIGVALPGWRHVVQKFGRTLHNQKLLIQIGMLINNKTHKYDRFRNRIIFPIRNISGKTIAFGGRIIQHTKNTPKYLNSPDTTIFKKTQHLYGLYETYKKCKNPPYILLVEGYIDVITLTQFEINYAVATLGTSITSKQIKLLYNITNQIICCYDGDYAGKKAAWHTLNVILPYLTDNRQINFIFLPPGEDPDTLVRKIGKEKFLQKLKKTQTIVNFLFEILSKKIQLHTLTGKIELIKLITSLLNKIPGNTLKLYLRQQLGNKIGILDENKLNQLTKHTQKKTITPNIFNQPPLQYNTIHILISLLIQYPKLAQLIPIKNHLQYCNNENTKIFIQLIQICQKQPTLTTAQILEYYRKNILFTKLETLAYWNHMIENDVIEITFIDTLIKLYNLILEQRQNILIKKDRIIGLKQYERQELWLLNKTLMKN